MIILYFIFFIISIMYCFLSKVLVTIFKQFFKQNVFITVQTFS